MSNNALIDLVGFRQRNGITQAQLAALLGVTRGNISLMESAGRISSQHIDTIYNHYSRCGLIPAFDRLLEAENYLVKEDYLESYNLSNDIYPFQELFSQDIIKSIKYGKVGITSDIANTIVTTYPIINKEWLISGEGDMISQPQENELNERLTAIENTQKQILAKLDKLISLMKIE